MKDLLPGTASRVKKHTGKDINADINRETISNIVRFIGKDQEKTAMKHIRGDFNSFTNNPEEISKKSDMG